MSNDGWAARCDALSKVYQTGTSRVPALRGVTAEFRAGALTAVAGPSGSGKSSLLRLLAGLDSPTEGRLWIDDVAIHAASGRAVREVRRRVGSVFQRGTENYIPYLTLDEHVRVATRRAVHEPVIPVDELLELLEIAHRRGHRVDELSGGEQARGAIAQVLAGGARLVTADEPTAELDTRSGTALVEAIRRVVGLGVTFVVASHDRAVVANADDVVRLEHGSVHRPGSGLGVASERLGVAFEPPGLDTADTQVGLGASARADVSTGAAVEVVVDVARVTKSYRRGDEAVHALVDVELAVRRGESVALVGRSGSGKTTLLNVTAGWEPPDAGRVRTLGAEPHGAPPGWFDVAVVPQRLGLLRELTIRENVELPFRLAGGLVADERRAAVAELLEELGIAELADRRPAECSLGEQQRASVARALAVEPTFLVADEPTAHLDAGSTRTVFGAIERRVLAGMTFLVATHDPEVLEHVDRIVSMRDGRIVVAG